jgi:hypothetical protein
MPFKKKKKSTIEVIPSARRLIKSMREVGYDFVHAVADIVDNSIEANASWVAIKMEFDGENSWLRISDNGTGMPGAAITEAMRFGTKRDYEVDELGKFGLGLKTASISQCSRLTVASRTNHNARRIEVRQWDLEHINNTDRWEIIDIPPDNRTEIIVEPLNETVGTVVLWEQLDRVFRYRIPWGEKARASFFRLADELNDHLGMVFHRFLAGEARRKKKLKITINETQVEPWDPYARNEKTTVRLPGLQFEISGDDGKGLVSFTPYILPSQDRFSSRRAFDHYAGPSKWNFQQGFYVYRADRMIQSGGWCHMRTSDEHTKLARVALDFRPDLDSAFEVNFAKTKVILPADLRTQLKPHIEDITKRARKAYTPESTKPSATTGIGGAGNQSGTPTSTPLNVAGQRLSQSKETTEITTSPLRLNPDGRLGRILEQAAMKAGEVPALDKIRNVLKVDNPDAAHEIGW